MKYSNRIFSIFILIALLAVSLGVTAQPAVAVGSYVCIPTCTVNDGRMLSIASTGFSTLAGQTIEIKIGVPDGILSFNVGIFDGDTGGLWDKGSTPLTYSLFADPTNTGKTSIFLSAWLGSSMKDNDWYEINITQDEQAKSPSGDYFYLLQITLPFASTIESSSSFKIRSESSIELSANKAFAYIIPAITKSEFTIIYPSGFPSATLPNVATTYDGTMDFYFYVPNSVTYIEIWDGDMDYGSYDCVNNDSDDLNTPNDVKQPWTMYEASTAQFEGIATTTNNCKNASGQVTTGYTTGFPTDDSSSLLLRRSPSVVYDVFVPGVELPYRNDNPSGNQEWERFRIDSDTSATNSVADYYHTGLLPAGVYRIKVSGLDLYNLNAWYFTYNPLGVPEVPPNTPPLPPSPPVLHPYKIGDTVWEDSNGNGLQDNGETGFPGVTVTLLDVNGQPVPGGTAVTDANGQYSFKVDVGTYSVQVDDSNFTTGILTGYFSTTGGNQQTDTVSNKNILTYDFGYHKAVNFCAFIRSPGFWKNYTSQGISDEDFQSMINATQDFKGLSVTDAVTILKMNKGTSNITGYIGVDAGFLKFLLSAEINAVWNGQDGVGGMLKFGSYGGQTVNEFLSDAYDELLRNDLSKLSSVTYLGAGGESDSMSTCLVQP